MKVIVMQSEYPNLDGYKVTGEYKVIGETKSCWAVQTRWGKRWFVKNGYYTKCEVIKGWSTL